MACIGRSPVTSHPRLQYPLNYFRLVRLIEQLTRSHVSVSRFDTNVVSRTPSPASDLKSLAEKCYIVYRVIIYFSSLRNNLKVFMLLPTAFWGVRMYTVHGRIHARQSLITTHRFSQVPSVCLSSISTLSKLFPCFQWFLAVSRFPETWKPETQKPSTI